MQAKTIDEVIVFLNQIIKESETNQSPLGYFAALYCKVTIRIKKGIDNKEFEDNKRMEELDVIFANRYLQAYTEYKNKEKPSLCWEVAFKESKRYWPIVLQHLLLGMNAHINLDLSIAAAQVAPGAKINGLKKDFDTINTILASLVTGVEKDLSEIWPTLKYILKLTGKVDDFLVNFSMKLARNGAWKFAKELAKATKEEQKALIIERDTKIAALAKYIIKPGFIASSLFVIIRLGEKGTVAKKIEDLNT